MASEEFDEVKLVVTGSGGSGKSCVTNFFLTGIFTEAYDPTIEDSYVKKFEVDGEAVVLDIIDTAGQEEYTAMLTSYLRVGQGFFIVYAINDRSSFQDVVKLRDRLWSAKDKQLDEHIPLVLIGNKCDLESEREVKYEEGQELATSFKCIFLETSAKTGKNISEVFHQIVKDVRRDRKANGYALKKVKAPGEDMKKKLARKFGKWGFLGKFKDIFSGKKDKKDKETKKLLPVQPKEEPASVSAPFQVHTPFGYQEQVNKRHTGPPLQTLPILATSHKPAETVKAPESPKPSPAVATSSPSEARKSAPATSQPSNGVPTYHHQLPPRQNIQTSSQNIASADFLPSPSLPPPSPALVAAVYGEAVGGPAQPPQANNNPIYGPMDPISNKPLTHLPPPPLSIQPIAVQEAEVVDEPEPEPEPASYPAADLSSIESDLDSWLKELDDTSNKMNKRLSLVQPKVEPVAPIAPVVQQAPKPVQQSAVQAPPGRDIYGKVPLKKADPLALLGQYPWFFGNMSGGEADQKLAGEPIGTYLFRFSSQNGFLAASYVDTTGVQRCLVAYDSDGFWMTDESTTTPDKYPTLDSLVKGFEAVFTRPFTITQTKQVGNYQKVPPTPTHTLGQKRF